MVRAIGVRSGPSNKSKEGPGNKSKECLERSRQQGESGSNIIQGESGSNIIRTRSAWSGLSNKERAEAISYEQLVPGVV